MSTTMSITNNHINNKQRFIALLHVNGGAPGQLPGFELGKPFDLGMLFGTPLDTNIKLHAHPVCLLAPSDVLGFQGNCSIFGIFLRPQSGFCVSVGCLSGNPPGHGAAINQTI